MFAHRFTRLACALAYVGAAQVAWADVSNLERGYPVELTDAQPIKAGEKQWQVGGRLDRQRSGDYQFAYEPQVQWGLAQGWQVSAAVRGLAGSADRTGSGDIRAQVFHRFNDESGLMPATAAEFELALPTGRNTRGVDSTLRLIASKSVDAARRHQVHANIAWTWNRSPQPGERPERGQVVVGWSTRLNEKTAVVADFVREQQRERGAMASLAEVGLRREVNSGTTLSLAGGAGRGSEGAPRWRLAAGIERSF